MKMGGFKEFLLARIPGYKPQPQVLPASQAVMGRGGLTPQQALAQQQMLAEQQSYFALPDALAEVEKFDGLALKVMQGGTGTVWTGHVEASA